MTSDVSYDILPQDKHLVRMQVWVKMLVDCASVANSRKSRRASQISEKLHLHTLSETLLYKSHKDTHEDTSVALML